MLFIAEDKKTCLYKYERFGRTPAKKIYPCTQIFYPPISKITGIEGNLVRLKNVPAKIQIGKNYKPELMEIIRVNLPASRQVMNLTGPWFYERKFMSGKNINFVCLTPLNTEQVPNANGQTN